MGCARCFPLVRWSGYVKHGRLACRMGLLFGGGVGGCGVRGWCVAALFFMRGGGGFVPGFGDGLVLGRGDAFGFVLGRLTRFLPSSTRLAMFCPAILVTVGCVDAAPVTAGAVGSRWDEQTGERSQPGHRAWCRGVGASATRSPACAAGCSSARVSVAARRSSSRGGGWSCRRRELQATEVLHGDHPGAEAVAMTVMMAAKSKAISRLIRRR